MGNCQFHFTGEGSGFKFHIMLFEVFSHELSGRRKENLNYSTHYNMKGESNWTLSPATVIAYFYQTDYKFIPRFKDCGVTFSLFYLPIFPNSHHQQDA